MSLLSLGAASWIYNTINTIWFSLNLLIYKVINGLYQVFINISNVNLFSQDVFDKIVGRLYIVMAIAMLFIFAYNLIFLVVDPDGKQKGSLSKIVKDSMISLVAVVLLPLIFNYLYIFQYDIINTGIIETIILGGSGNGETDKSNCATGDYDCTCIFNKSTYHFDEYKQSQISTGKVFITSTSVSTNTVDVSQKMSSFCSNYRDNKIGYQRGASSLASTIFSAFYYPNDFSYDYCANYLYNNSNDPEGLMSDPENRQICINYFVDVNASRYTGSIMPFQKDNYLRTFLSDPDSDKIEFNYIFSLIAGGLACYMFCCYALKVGVRVAKLGFLQIISPIPVMLRILPGQGMFKKWFDNIKSTYLDVFIRIAIIDFTMFGISLVPDLIKTVFNNSFTGTNFAIKSLTLVVIILGLMQFASDAPALFKELFGGKGDFSLKSPRKQIADNKIAMRGVNAFRGGMYGATTGAGLKGKVGGLFSGAARGAVGGYDKAVKGLDIIRTERANHSTHPGRTINRIRKGLGMEYLSEKDERENNRRVELKFHTKVRTESNNKMNEHISKIKDAVNKRIEDENSKLMLSVDYKDAAGNTKSVSNLNYASMLKYREALQEDANNAVGDAAKAAAITKLQNFTAALNEAKTVQRNAAISSGITGGNYGGLLRDSEIATIQTNVSKMNEEIAKGHVAEEFDEDGETTSTFTTRITDAAGMKSLEDALGSQGRNIAEHGGQTFKDNYEGRAADTRVVKGTGQQEKK